MILIAGMSSPVQLNEIYCVLRAGRQEDDYETPLTVDDIIRDSRASAILFAPPGRGKSVTLQHAFSLLSGNEQAMPLLYLLREPDSCRELGELLFALKEEGVRKFTSQHLVLLLDGYDEIDYSERVSLSAMLREFNMIDDVRFYSYVQNILRGS